MEFERVAPACPTPYSIKVEPGTLRSSISTLLKELQQTNVDLDSFVLGDMEETLSDTVTLHSMLLPVKQTNASNSAVCKQATSLIKVLLRQPFLQSRLLTILLQTLPSLEEAQSSSSSDTTTPLSKNLGRLILSNIRWLDMIYDTPNLTSTALDILGVCDKSMQQDLISILPDIIPDSAADDVVQSLLELKQDDNSLLLPILDAVSSLRLSPSSLDLITTETLNEISAADPSSLPGIARFLMHHTDQSSNNKIIEELRKRLSLQSSDDQAVINSYALTFEALCQGFQYRSDLTSSLLTQIKGTTDSAHHSTADIYLLMCANNAPHNKSKVTNSIRKQCHHNIITKALVDDSIRGLGKQMSSLFPSYISLADSLLRAPESPSRELGSAIYSGLFLEFSDLVLRQDIVAHLTTHVGSGTPNEVGCSLSVLQALAYRNAAELRPFSAFVTSMLDCMSSMTLAQTRRLFVILFSLNAEGNESDTIQIVVRKHLSHSLPRMKKVGIIGVVAFVVVKSQGCRRDNMVSARETSETSSAQYLKEITDMLELANDSCDPRKNCNMKLSDDSPSPLGYLFDELALAIKGKQIAPVVKNWILARYKDVLEEEFMGEFVEGNENRENEEGGTWREEREWCACASVIILRACKS